MEMDKIAQEKIKEQDEEINDLHILLDLANESNNDLLCELRVAQAQIWNLKNDRHYEVG